jgi:lysophospholipase L1-like esterase
MGAQTSVRKSNDSRDLVLVRRMLLIQNPTAMMPTGWTSLAFVLFLALPLSREVVAQPGSARGADVIVLFGHSHVENWKVTSLAGFRTINRGRGGDRTQDLLDRFERDVVSSHPRAVVIWAFDNDVMDVPNRYEAAAMQHAEANLVKLIGMAKARSIEPILTTEVTILSSGLSRRVGDAFLSLFGKSSYEERVNSRIVKWNDWVRKEVQSRHLLLLDFQRSLADSSERRRPSYAVPDGVHLTNQAYAVITREAEATLSARLRQ